MKLEVMETMVHCQVRGKPWRICRCDVAAWKFLRALPVMKDWLLVGEDFAPSAIQQPGKPPQGTRIVVFATPEPQWFGEQVAAAAKQLSAEGVS